MEFTDFHAYKKGFALAMKIFKISKNLPKDEKYSLTDQVRRSSRSVCSNLAEAYRKRNYPKHFISKLSDCDGENSETLVWFEFAKVCDYIDESTFEKLKNENKEIGKLINYMILNPQKFGCKPDHLPVITDY